MNVHGVANERCQIVAVAVFLLCILAQGRAVAQERIRIPEPGPDTEQLLVENLGSIVEAGKPRVFRGPPGGVVRLRDGGVLLSVTAAGEPLYRLDSAGGVAKELPLQFPSINRISVTPEDSVVVWDQGNGQMIVLSSTLEVERRSSLPFSPANSLIGLSGGTVVSEGLINTPQLVGRPFHLIDANGHHIRSFGDHGVFRADQSYSLPRPLSASDRGITAGYVDRYELEQWSLAGEFVSTIERLSPWFPSEGVSLPRRGEVPPTVLVAIHEDQGGLIWTAVLVPSDGWREVGLSGPKGSEISSSVELAGLWDTRIEVINVSERTVVGIGLVPGMVSHFLDDNHVAVAEPVDGGWAIGFWRVSHPLTLSGGSSNGIS